MSAASSAAWRIGGIVGARRASSAAGGEPAAPLVAVLCTAPRARVAAAALALALAHATDRSCALVAAAGFDAGGALGGLPAARRTAARLTRRGLPATASGRLVRLGDRRAPSSDAREPLDLVAGAAALSAEVGRSAAAAGVPGVVAFPFPRIDALDRVLAWHDAIVVVREPDTPAPVIGRALRGLAALGRPAAAMAPPARLPGALAVAGIAAPVEAVTAIAQLVRSARAE